VQLDELLSYIYDFLVILPWAAWAQLAFESDKDIRHQEVRVGVNTQHLPVFVRMLDKNSNWDNTNGLKTLINTALTFGILGYPFILKFSVDI
jgi:hypothetical protein